MEAGAEELGSLKALQIHMHILHPNVLAVFIKSTVYGHERMGDGYEITSNTRIFIVNNSLYSIGNGGDMAYSIKCMCAPQTYNTSRLEFFTFLIFILFDGAVVVVIFFNFVSPSHSISLPLLRLSFSAAIHFIFLLFVCCFGIYANRRSLYISSIFSSLIPFHRIQYTPSLEMQTNSSSTHSETVYINNKRCRRCQATDSECYCANTLPTTDNKSTSSILSPSPPHIVHG